MLQLTKIAREAETGASGPFEAVHAFWLAGMSCDGCTIALTGATAPSLEQLLGGLLPGCPRLVLHHPMLSESGQFVRDFTRAAEGTLGAPYVVVYEGSVADERIAGATSGCWSALGVELADGRERSVPTAEWLKRLAPGAAAVVSIGTCATKGGFPASAGNVTGAMSVTAFLGEGYVSTLGFPVVNVHGCPPVGNTFTTTVAAILLGLGGFAPLPAFDEKGQPVQDSLRAVSELVDELCAPTGEDERLLRVPDEWRADSDELRSRREEGHGVAAAAVLLEQPE
ncbi:MAG: hypothetical protein M3N31_06030 [Actinomycetota bacterium]|nr:hypothetical protein [Actinomycetota bacterium]